MVVLHALQVTVPSIAVLLAAGHDACISDVVTLCFISKVLDYPSQAHEAAVKVPSPATQHFTGTGMNTDVLGCCGVTCS